MLFPLAPSMIFIQRGIKRQLIRLRADGPLPVGPLKRLPGIEVRRIAGHLFGVGYILKHDGVITKLRVFLSHLIRIGRIMLPKIVRGIRIILTDGKQETEERLAFRRAAYAGIGIGDAERLGNIARITPTHGCLDHVQKIPLAMINQMLYNTHGYLGEFLILKSTPSLSIVVTDIGGATDSLGKSRYGGSNSIVLAYSFK